MPRGSGRTFEHYREIVAKRATPATETACGHPVEVGDRIGYAHRRRGNPSAIQCAQCWARWQEEVAEARWVESASLPNPW